MCGKFATSISFLLLLQLPEVLFQPAIASYQASNIKQMNGPSGGVSGVKKLYGGHCPLRLSATFGFRVSADDPLSSPSKDSSARASSTSRRIVSRRNGAPHTRK